MKNKKILFAIIVDNSKSIICQNGIKINCSHILPANKNFTFAIFDIFFLFPAIFDNLPPYSPRSTVPVLGAQTGTVTASNPLCHKASPSPNIDKDKYFHSVNSSQYDSIRTENSSKNGSIHNPTDYRIF